MHTPPNSSHFLELLQERGLVAQASHEDELGELLAHGPFDAHGKRYGVYAGFDPTARSLHVGHLLVILGLRRAQDRGLTPIIVFGGATGMIGDPTGRTELRQMNSREVVDGYIENFKTLIGRYFRTDVPNAPVYVNNDDWMRGMDWLSFLRDVGSHFTIARLLSAEVNRSRYEAGGLTFMELGYQLLQSYDFLVLSRTHNCILQVGGNDQWSNILSGADLIRRVDGRKAFALTFPLLVGSDGRKYGKTAGNAVWLDGSMFAPYEFFQFFRNVSDADVAMMMRLMTFEPLARIEELTGPDANINASKEFLAFEMTALVHGKEEAEKAFAAARALFSGGGDLSSAPTTLVSRAEVEEGLGLLALLVRAGLAASNGEARKLIQGNGLAINGEKCADPHRKVESADFQTEQGALVLKKGKKDFHLVRLADLSGAL
jgi:tyrosyl-tRNA synthetase